MPSFARDVLSVAGSKGLIIALTLFRSVILARWLGPEGSGIIAAIVIYPSIFMTVGSLGIRQATTFIVGRGIYPLEEVKAAIIQLWILSAIVSSLVSYVLVRHLSTGGDDIWLVFLAIAPIPFSLFNTYNTGIFLGQNQIRQFNRVNWIPPLIVFAATVVLVVILSTQIYGAMLAAACGPLVMYFMLLHKNGFYRSFRVSINVDVIKSLLSLGLMYALALLVLNLNYKIDIVLLDRITDSREVGIYSKGAHIIEYLWHIPMLLSTITFARSASAENPNAFSKKVSQLLRLSLVAVAGLSIVLAACSPWIIVGLYGPDFSESVSVLRLLLPGVVLLTILKVVAMDLAGRGKPWLYMKSMLPALAVNIILNLILIPEYGADGAALSSTLSYSVGGILCLIFYARETEQPLREILLFRMSDAKPIITGLNGSNVLFRAR